LNERTQLKPPGAGRCIIRYSDLAGKKGLKEGIKSKIRIHTISDGILIKKTRLLAKSSRSSNGEVKPFIWFYDIDIIEKP